MELVVTKYKNSIPGTVKPNTRPYEEVKLDQFKTNAKCVAFHTTPSRVSGWLCAFSLRFYEQLGASKEYIVNWKDKTEDDDNIITETVVTLHRIQSVNESEKLLTITVYFSTLTIMIQGSCLHDFALSEFPLLKATVEHLYSVTRPKSGTEGDKCKDSDQMECQSKDRPTLDLSMKEYFNLTTRNIEEDKTNTSLLITTESEVMKPVPTQEEQVTYVKVPYRPTTDPESDIKLIKPSETVNELGRPTQPVRVVQNETNMLLGLSKPLTQIAACLETLVDFKQAITNIESSVTTHILGLKDSNTVLQLQITNDNLTKEHSKNKLLDQKIRGLQSELDTAKIIPPTATCKHNEQIGNLTKYNTTLQEKVKSLQAQVLVLEEEKIKAAKAQEEIVCRLQKNKESLLKDVTETESRLTNKLESIKQLERKIVNMQKELDTSHDEVMAWKIHDQRERTHGTHSDLPVVNPNKINNASVDSESTGRPTTNEILLIGTSIVKDIDADNLLWDYHTTKVNKYHVKEAKEYVMHHEGSKPVAVVIQEMSNDIKQEDKNSQQCAEELIDLVETTKAKFPAAAVILSLPPGRGDRKLHLKTQAANVAVKQKYINENIVICDNSNLLTNDCATPTFFKEDLIHLNTAGSRRLAANIRSGLRKGLNIHVDSKSPKSWPESRSASGIPQIAAQGQQDRPMKKQRFTGNRYRPTQQLPGQGPRHGKWKDQQSTTNVGLHHETNYQRLALWESGDRERHHNSDRHHAAYQPRAFWESNDRERHHNNDRHHGTYQPRNFWESSDMERHHNRDRSYENWAVDSNERGNYGR